MTLWALALACAVPDDEPRGACPAETVGRFELLESGGVASFTGQVYDAAMPGDRVESAVTSACVLEQLPLCACAPGEVCRADGSCAPYPSTVDQGTLVFWTTEEKVSLEPLVPGHLYSHAPDLAASDTPVRLEGTDVLHTRVAEPLSLVDDEVTLTSGQPIQLAWTGEGAVVELSVDQHGASQTRLRCAFDGEGGEVPAAAVDALLDAGRSGFPNGRVFRAVVDHGDGGPGCVELVSRSERRLRVEVE